MDVSYVFFLPSKELYQFLVLFLKSVFYRDTLRVRISLTNTQLFKHILTLVEFGVGKDNGNSLTFIQHKIVTTGYRKLLYGVVNLVLYRLYQLLSFFEQISLKTKA